MSCSAHLSYRYPHCHEKLNRLFATLFGADTDSMLNGTDEDFTVTNLSCPGSFDINSRANYTTAEAERIEGALK